MFDLFYDWIIHVLPNWLQGFFTGLLAGILMTIGGLWLLGS